VGSTPQKWALSATRKVVDIPRTLTATKTSGGSKPQNGQYQLQKNKNETLIPYTTISLLSNTFVN
jgi:hypothetical protein